jgi:hypothetical protein
MTPEEIEGVCTQIREHHKNARLCMKHVNAGRQRTASHVVFVRLGYTPGDKTALKKGYSEARKYMLAALKDETHEFHALASATEAGIAPWESERVAHEKRMVVLVKQLPVYAWTKPIKGFGELGLAQIVAEAGGPLDKFSTVSRLWKRLGLAVISGNRQGAPGKGASAEDWMEHGYNRERRAIVWSIVSDSMFRHQWAAAGEGEETGKPKGPYGEVYAQRRARTAITHPDWTKGHAHNDARRVMTKKLIADLWSAWRQAIPPAKPTSVMSVATNSAQGVACHADVLLDLANA